MKIRVPGSKSITHRAFLLAAQSTVPCTVTGALRSADTNATLACLHRLGFQVRPDADVHFLPAQPLPPREVLDCRNSGTTLRLLTGTAARFPFRTAFTGDESLQKRPNGPLLEALRSLGADAQGDAAPYVVGGPLRAGHATLPAGVSSQYGSSLLLSLPMLEQDSRLTMTGPVASAPYLDITTEVASSFGLRIDADSHDYHIPGGQQPAAPHFAVEGDWSTAAFPLVAAAISGRTVTVEGVRPDSHQGDRTVLDHLAAFGARVQGTAVTAGDLVSPGQIDVSATPDMFPALCILAAYAQGTTTFTGGAALRHKESDRIAAMAKGLDAMGIHVKEHEDGLDVAGGAPRGAKIHAFDDHRIHMAFAIAGLASDGPVEVDGADSAAVSYPTFHEDLARLEAT